MTILGLHSYLIISSETSAAYSMNPFWHKLLISILNVTSSGGQFFLIISSISSPASSHRPALHKPFNAAL
uniref:Uncharacterized protein n=1 Tax=Arundo donax TaxID=35708 RepID=A0A0A9GNG9_ARUDO